MHLCSLIKKLLVFNLLSCEQKVKLNPPIVQEAFCVLLSSATGGPAFIGHTGVEVRCNSGMLYPYVMLSMKRISNLLLPVLGNGVPHRHANRTGSMDTVYSTMVHPQTVSKELPSEEHNNTRRQQCKHVTRKRPYLIKLR